MNSYDTQLQQLQAQVARAAQLESMLRELRNQRELLAGEVRKWDTLRFDEQADVDRLEGRSLAAFFYNVIGKMDEKLSKEREEAYAASVKYEAAVKELQLVETQLERYQSELAGLRGCVDRYEAAYREKSEWLKRSGGLHAEQILRMEAQIFALENQKRELSEAITAGDAALGTTEQVLSSLGNAKNWGTLDMFGGGLIADMVKHDHLDKAQAAIERLQDQLLRFKTELADVTIYADMQVNVEGFLRFADYFFDGLFVDWAVLDKINRSSDQVMNTRNQIERVIAQLEIMLEDADRQQAQIKRELDALVLDAQG